MWLRPCFSLFVVVTIALAIGATTAVFCVFRVLLLSPPPYPDGQRLVQIWEASSGQRLPVSWLNFQHLVTENRSFDHVAGFEAAEIVLTNQNNADVLRAGVVSSNFFQITGWHPLSGRLFTAADDRPGASPVVVVTREFWTRKLGADPSVVGRVMVLDGVSFQVIGVLPEGLRFFPQQIEVYLPLGLREGAATDPASHGAIVLLGKLRLGVSRNAAAQDLNIVMKRSVAHTFADEAGHRISVEWLADFGREGVRQTMISLMAATLLLLIIACANVAGLLLLRSTQRLGEIATRSALGATYSRLAQLLLTETLVYFALGGVLGSWLAKLALQLLRGVAPQDIPRLYDARLSLPILLVTLAVTLVSGVAAGLVPVVNLARLNLAGALDCKRGLAGPIGRQTLRNGLLVAQVALTIILFFSCNSLLRSLTAAQNVHPGFDGDHVLALDLQLPPHRYKNDAASATFYRRLVDRIRELPGVRAAGVVNCPPSTGGCARGWYSIPGLPVPSPADVPLTLLTTVDAGYFHAVRMRWVAGHSFSESGVENGDDVVVNEKLARRWWPQNPEAAVGSRLKLGGPYAEGATKTIIGVVGDVNQEALDAEPASEVYVQGVQSAMVVIVRSSLDLSSLAKALRTAVESVDREVPVRSLQSLNSRMRSTLDRRQFTTWLFELFAALAATMSAVGIYGVLSFQVQSRQKELAIRVAVGAGNRDIMVWLARHLLGIGAAGVLIGAAGSVGAARLLAGMVFGIQPTYLSSLSTACSTTLLLAATAGAIPVLRAIRTDPLPELRR
ncbi:MAG: hypothetical protein JWN34_3852 [Bryobacterales bacterium]|nr:hypothetical protein [Bryobacterales bacterium]